MAGGKGLRLHPLTKFVPKPLLKINNTICYNDDCSGKLDMINSIYLSITHSEKMINLSKCNSRGFTLIELVLTVIAIGIFGAITANILGNASKVYDATLKKQKFVSEARHSFFRLNRDFNLQTWAMNDDISNPKSLNIESANGWQLQYDLQTNNNLRLNLIQHSNLSPTSEVLSKNTHYPSSNVLYYCLLYTSPSPRDRTRSRMPSSA